MERLTLSLYLLLKKKKKGAELKSILPSRMAAFNERLITKKV